MSSLPSNLHRLRILSQQHHELTEGGMYATFQAPGQVVRAEAETPSVMDQQVWCIEPAPHKGENVVTIAAYGINGPAGLAYWHNLSDDGDARIILGEEKYFKRELLTKEKGIPIYIISPLEAPERMGASFLVGTETEQDGEVACTKWYPVIRDMDGPVWAFYPA